MLTAQHSRMARAGLGLSIRELAEAARVSTATIVRLERGDALHERTVAAIRAVFEAAGAEFTNSGVPGVLIRPRANDRS